MKRTGAISLVAVLAVTAAGAVSALTSREQPSSEVAVVPAGGVTGSTAIPASLASDSSTQAATEVTSDWAKVVDGRLVYRTSDKGDRIMDFSTAGYAGGGTALPSGIPIRITIAPSGGDDTAIIQQAIDNVSARDRGTDRYKGVVKLAAGTFHISSTININSSAVIVAGSGSGTNGTIVEMTGSTGFLAFRIGNAADASLTNAVALTSSYLPSGSDTLAVASTSGFTVGQRIQVSRTVTQDWLHYIGMDSLVRDGQPQTWLAAGTIIATPRAIKAINAAARTITLDAPVTDSFDATYLGSPVGTVSAAAYPSRIVWVGLEHLTIKAPVGKTVYSAVRMSNVINGYISDVVGQETQNAFNVDDDALQVTLDRVINNNSTVQTNAAPTADFSITGSQVFVNKSESNSRGTWGVVTGARGVGPAVLLKFKAPYNRGVAPHQRWYTGMLVDSSSIPGGDSTNPGVAFSNRTNLGTGHGWTTGWSVAWNVTSPYFKIQAAPGSMNWCIGCTGERVSASPSGTYSAQNATVAPASLYLQQLQERKGAAALAAIGYASTTP